MKKITITITEMFKGKETAKPQGPHNELLCKP
jgi:hypothetical protein